VAYDAPGPRMMLEEAFLVSPGGTDEFAARIVSLLRDPAGLQHARFAARRRASDFQWKEIAEKTAAVYAERLDRIRNNPSAGLSVSLPDAPSPGPHAQPGGPLPIERT
jgi:hypothetical protein